MATAETKTKVTDVTLTLTMDEAAVLRAIMFNVGGRSGGPRGKADAIASALDRVGITPDTPEVDAVLMHVYGPNTAICFQDAPTYF